MQLREYDIKLDIRKGGNVPRHTLVQNDNQTNIFNISLYDDDILYDLSDTIIDIVFVKPDGTVVTQGTQDSELPLTIEDNIIKCIIKTNTIAAHGTVNAEVKVSNTEGKLLTSQTFKFYVRKSLLTDNAVESTNEFPLLQRLINEVEVLINTLEDKISEVQSLEDTVTANEYQRQENEQAREHLKQELEQLQSELLTLQYNLNNALEAAIETNNNIVQAENEREQAELLREQLKGELEQLQIALSGKIDIVNGLISDMEDLIGEVEQAEQARQQAESERDNAEGVRQQAEESRELAEGERVQAEQQREQTFAGYDSRITNVEDDLAAHKLDYATQHDIGITNLILNGNFSQGTTHWTFPNGSMTALSGEVEVTLTTLGTTSSYLGQGVQKYANHVYYARFEIKSKYANNASILINDAWVGEKVTTPGIYTLISATHKPGADGAVSHATLRYRHDTNTEYIVGDKIYYRNMMLVDLTNIFGAGNEPTKLEMDELMKVIPNGWWDGELTLTQKQFITWQLNLIRKNTSAIIALGGTII